jgi:hypothetical protein
MSRQSPQQQLDLVQGNPNRRGAKHGIRESRDTTIMVNIRVEIQNPGMLCL